MVESEVSKRGRERIKSQLFQPKKVIDYIKKNGTHIQVKKDEYIYHSGDKTDSIYLLESGEVFVFRVQDEGAELVTHFLNENSIFGAVTLFYGPKYYNTFAQAKIACDLYRIDKTLFENMIYQHPEFTKEWMTWVDIERSRHSTKLRDLFMFGKKGALASVLIRLSNSFGVKVKAGILIDTKLTNQELAMLIGTSREVVNRHLKILKNDGVITIDQKKITITNLSQLKSINNCENCDINICQIY